MNSSLGNKQANFAKVRSLLNAVRSGSLIILPETFATGYLPKNPSEYAEDFSSRDHGETAKFLSDLANETGCTVMGAGIALNSDGKLRNHSSVYAPGCNTEIACYDKVHPFFPELKEFNPGKDVNLFKIVSTTSCNPNNDGVCSQWAVGSAICYDLRFPELFRDITKKGARLITVQAAWPAVRIEHWITLLKARAIENQVYIAAVNGVSNQENAIGGIPLGGTSLVISPLGEILASGNSTDECVIKCTICSKSQEEYRNSFPVLKGIV